MMFFVPKVLLDPGGVLTFAEEFEPAGMPQQRRWAGKGSSPRSMKWTRIVRWCCASMVADS